MSEKGQQGDKRKGSMIGDRRVRQAHPVPGKPDRDLVERDLKVLIGIFPEASGDGIHLGKTASQLPEV